MTKTIDGTYPGLVSLALAGDNPTTITSTSLLEAGLYAESIGVDWMITNAGTVQGAGIKVGGAGSVTNQAGGTISGLDGIYDNSGALTVVNAGAISGSVYAVDFAAGFTNRLVIDPGAVFGGTVSGGNALGGPDVSTLELASGASDGTITSPGTQFVDFAQITIDAAASWTLTGTAKLDGATLTDAGTATNAGYLSGAVTLDVGAALTNASGSTITVASGSAVYGVAGGAATVVNAGTISSAYPGGTYGISLMGGGTVTNLGGATISGAVGVYGDGALTVVNYGNITAYDGDGIDLNAGGSVTNLASGVISGYGGGVYADASATVVNYGIISASNYAGVGLDAGGSMTNLSGGTISGYSGVYANAGATVVNGGLISASDYAGVRLYAGSSVTNLSGGIITGYYGISASGGAIVVNAGTISGSYQNAVEFAAGSTNRLIIDPGAVFVGTVTGGNPIGDAYVSTLELASGALDGTITSLGVQYVDFAQITIDAGASWTLNGPSYLYGAALIDAGTLTNVGYLDGAVTLDGGAVLTNASTATITVASGAAVYGLAGGGAATVVNAGTISSAYPGGTYGVFLDGGGTVTNQVSAAISGYTGIFGGIGGGLTVVNYGAIIGYGLDGDGVRVVDGGSVTNEIGGTIGGYDGIYSGVLAALTVVNYGSIAGYTFAGSGLGGSGVRLVGGGGVTNESGGAISGFNGVYAGVNYAVTLLNDGVILGDAAYGAGAVLLGGGSVINYDTISGGNGISASGAYNAMTVVNYGSIAAYGAHGAGVFLYAGGGLTNQIGATISGYFGVSGDGGGLTVVNYGAIEGNSADSNGAGIFLSDGGSVTNQSGGTISGYYGVDGYGTALTVVNAGAIEGSSTYPRGAGIYLYQGGSVSNQSGGTISGYYGVDGYGTALTVVNAGAIEGSSTYPRGAGIYLYQGGSVSNQSGGAISGSTGVYGYDNGAVTLVNDGVITGDASYGVGVLLFGGGYVTNGSGGKISGGSGISGSSSYNEMTVVNSGGITATGSHGAGVYIYAGGGVTNQSGATITGYGGIVGVGFGALTVVNYGSIGGNLTLSHHHVGAEGVGIYLGDGGIVTNDTSATISGFVGVEGAPTGGDAATVVNSGVIAGNTRVGAGVALGGGGSVTNQSGGTIKGHYGVHASGYYNAVTVMNYGSIAGTGQSGVGVYLHDNSLLTNWGGATISGYTGILGLGDGLTVVNYGSIAGDMTHRLGTGVAVDDGGGYLTNWGGGTISGYDGVYSGNGSALSLVNYGVIAGNTTLTDGTGVVLGDTAYVLNWSTISGFDGVYANRLSYLTLVNYGSIAGATVFPLGTGVFLNNSGSVTNASGGTISGYNGVYSKYGAVTLVNAGDISGNNFAVQFAYGYTSQLVIDPDAVFVGTVSGGNTIGASFVSTLELAAGPAGGTLSGFGTQYIDFAQVTIDTGASWTLTGANYFAAGVTLTNDGTLTVSNTTVVDAGSVVNDGSIVMDPSTLTLADLTGTGEVFIGAGGSLVTQGTVSGGETIDFASQSGWLALTPADFAGEIVGFFHGDTIDLTGITDATSASIISGNTLQIEDGGTPILLTLDPSQDYTGVTFTVGTDSSPNHYNTITTDLACFAEGTRLDTPGGPVAVEALRAGDFVLTASGPPRKVRWIGWRRLDLRRHPDPAAAQPVRVLANAVAPGEPRCDVRLSPSHALLVGGVLIPVGRLVNGATIRREDCCRSVTYFHVELETHDVLLAEGLAAESYLDTGNRGMFENADAPLMLHPELGAHNDQARREACSCAPFVADAVSIEPVWHALAERARALGHVLAEAVTTADPALRVQVGGKVVAPVMVRDGCHVFVLPEMAGAVRLVSRATAPDALRPWAGDSRSLGVSVRRLTVRYGDGVEIIPLDHPQLRDGWWALEHDGGRHARWTNGSADLTLRLAFVGPVILEVEIGSLDGYLAAEAVAEPEVQIARRA